MTVWFFLTAVLLRALVPTGYMMAGDANHPGIRIEMCSARGEVPAFMDPESGSISVGNDDSAPHRNKAADEHHPCVFADTASALVAPVVEPSSHPDLSIAPQVIPASPGWPATRPTGPPLPARGPPALI
jgi:hypothetical protein